MLMDILKCLKIQNPLFYNVLITQFEKSFIIHLSNESTRCGKIFSTFPIIF